MAYESKFPLKEELVDDSHSTVKGAVGADFQSNEDAEKKREEEMKKMGKVIPPLKTEPEAKKENTQKRYKSPFAEMTEDGDDEIEGAEALVDSWINGNKSHVIEKIKASSAGEQEDIIRALVAHLVIESDESGIKGLIMGLMHK